MLLLPPSPCFAATAKLSDLHQSHVRGNHQQFAGEILGAIFGEHVLRTLAVAKRWMLSDRATLDGDTVRHARLQDWMLCAFSPFLFFSPLPLLRPICGSALER